MMNRKSVLIGFCVSSGLLSLMFLALTVRPGQDQPLVVVSFVADHKVLYALTAAFALIWAACSAPAFAASLSLLEKRDALLVRISALLGVGGIILFALSIIQSKVAFLLSIGDISRASVAETIYRVQSGIGQAYYLSAPGRVAWGFAMILAGALVLRRALLPRWLGTILLIGGVAGPMTMVVYKPPVAATQIACFAVWELASALLLKRNGRPGINLNH